jgi:hypothetical protein
MSKPKAKFTLKRGGVVPKNVTEEELKIRWSPDDQKALDKMKESLKADLQARSRGDIDSDHRLLHFYRGRKLHLDEAIKGYREHMLWRNKNNIDAIHDKMIAENLNPYTAPHGKLIIDLMPQTPCSFQYCDKDGNPLCVEYYGFNPENLAKVPSDTYMEWFVYASEYKMLLLEHFSAKAEQALISESRKKGKPLEVRLRCNAGQ